VKAEFIEGRIPLSLRVLRFLCVLFSSSFRPGNEGEDWNTKGAKDAKGRPETNPGQIDTLSVGEVPRVLRFVGGTTLGGYSYRSSPLVKCVAS
jgi:hypothetical protein